MTALKRWLGASATAIALLSAQPAAAQSAADQSLELLPSADAPERAIDPTARLRSGSLLNGSQPAVPSGNGLVLPLGMPSSPAAAPSGSSAAPQTGIAAPSTSASASGAPTRSALPVAGAERFNSFAPTESLSTADVQRVVRQAAAEAAARGTPATIAVTDRVGNVLAVYRTDGTDAATVNVRSGRQVPFQGVGATGLDQISNTVPASLAAIAKAVTGAFLSSGGNAFSTRTASQIVQENFNPGVRFQPGGPLFGVQFSQLPCSDLSGRFTDPTKPAPQRSPLGLSADPGGFPLYKNGQVVGGIGVMADGVYGLDRNVLDFDRNLDELIAVAGTIGYDAPEAIRANRIFAGGISLRYSDVGPDQLAVRPANANFADNPAFYRAVTGYTAGGVRAGTVYGTAASGIRPLQAGDVFTPVGLPVTPYVLVDNTNANRYRPIASTDGGNAPLTAMEVNTLLQEALRIAYRGRAQIRQPLDSFIQVSISVVDRNGEVLGLVRTPDAPIFGIDVSLQKARSAALFSRNTLGDELNQAATVATGAGISAIGFTSPTQTARIQSYVNAAAGFVGSNFVSAGGVGNFNPATGTAFTETAIGNIARPFYPDGINDRPNGPLSRPFLVNGQPDWSPFNVGLQLDLVLDEILEHVVHVVTGGGVADTGASCTGLPQKRAANGIQIFSGAVPVYRNGVLVGGIGVSGDGIDQDNMIAFLGTHLAGLQLGTGVSNAPGARRADQLVPAGVRLRYVSCPFKPFTDSDAQNVCDGL